MVWKVSHCFCINPLCNVWKRDRESTQRRWAELSACGWSPCRWPQRCWPRSCSSNWGRVACAHSAGLGLPQKGLVGSVTGVREVKKGWRGPGGFASSGWALANSSLVASLQLFCATCSLQPGLGELCREDFGPGFGHPWGQSSHKDQYLSKVPALRTPGFCEHQRANSLVLEPSCKNSLELWAFLSLPAHLHLQLSSRREILIALGW